MLRTRTSQITRRRIVIGGTTLALGAGALAVATGDARADVTMGTLELPDREFTPGDGEVYAPHLYISGEWSYSVSTTPAEWQVYLVVGDGSGNESAIDSASGQTSSLSSSGTYETHGVITDASAYSSTDFTAPGPGESTSVSVPVTVMLSILDGGGSEIVGAEISHTVTVTVTEEGTQAELGGDGVVAMQDDSGDPTPTPPP